MSPRTFRAGVTRTTVLFVLVLLVLAVLVGLLVRDARRPPAAGAAAPAAGAPRAQPLLVYCAAGLQAPVKEIADAWQAECHVPVQLQFGGSQTQLAAIEASHRGDLFIAADASYVRAARDRKLVEEELPLAAMRPVVAVKRGHVPEIRSLDDLLAPGVRVAQANPDAAAIGKLTRPALEKAGVWDALKQHTVVFTATVNEVANAVQIGSADAGIVWDTVAGQFPDLQAVEVAPLADVRSDITEGVLSSSTQPTTALRLARYVAARDRGLAVFSKHGYRVVEGDAWSEAPELRLLAGAMLRPAIEDTVRAFESREGCRVTRVYNGCGILVAQMRAGQRPDAYFACDASFMRQVSDLFLHPEQISSNRLVIVVPKGNPHHVRSLRDLGGPGLRVGVGHEKQCALGALTQQTLEQGGLRQAVMPNVRVQSPTGDFLVNQLRTGSLDAVVAYVSNTVSAASELETIDIDLPCAVATEPVAVGRDSDNRRLAGRLVEALESSQSKARFESQGFTWTWGRAPGPQQAASAAPRK